MRIRIAIFNAYLIWIRVTIFAALILELDFTHSLDPFYLNLSSKSDIFLGSTVKKDDIPNFRMIRKADVQQVRYRFLTLVLMGGGGLILSSFFKVN